MVKSNFGSKNWGYALPLAAGGFVNSPADINRASRSPDRNPERHAAQTNEKTTMETIDKISNSAHEAFDNIASATNQAAETLGEKDKQLKNAEQQLLKYYRNYIRYNPWISQ
jgi:hypothetical protein